MKRLLIFALCVALLVCMAGCGDSSQDSTTSTPPETTAPATPEFSETASQGLEFEVTEDGTGCVITGLGDCTDSMVVIPDTLDGYPVTHIADSAFYCADMLKGVRLGENVIAVGAYAFFECQAMEVVELNPGLTHLGQYAFSGCRKIKEITIPGTMEAVDAWAFFECSGLKAVRIDGLENWFSIRFGGAYANPLIYAGELYVDGALLTEVTVPEDLAAIGDWTFAGCKSLTQLYLHENVTQIGQRAFMECEGLTAVAYAGTSEQWKMIVLGSYWDFGMEEYVIRCQDKEIKG